MVECRQTWGYWFFDSKYLWSPRKWKIITHLSHDRYINFDCFSYRINNVVYKKDSSEFQNAVDKEILWDRLQK